MTDYDRIAISSYRHDGLRTRYWRVVDKLHSRVIYDGPNEERARKLRDKAVAELERIAALNAKGSRP